MGERLTLNTDAIKSIVKIFDSMYEENKLYNYVNFITIKSVGDFIHFEMCVIMDGSTSDSMMRLKLEHPHNPFSELTLNYQEFSKLIKSIRDDEFEMNIGDSNVSIVSTKTTRYLELSSVKIPTLIYNRLDHFLTLSSNELLDFNLLKLYNIIADLSTLLNPDILNRDLYGISIGERGVVATDGYALGFNDSYSLPTPFLFPKATIKILKLVPKLGAKYAIKNNAIHIVGKGFECYIGAWSPNKAYPNVYKVIDGIMDDLKEVEAPKEMFEAIKALHNFDEIAFIYPNIGEVTNKNKTHIERFTPTPSLNGGRILMHRNVFKVIAGIDTMYVDSTYQRLICKVDGKVVITMGLADKED